MIILQFFFPECSGEITTFIFFKWICNAKVSVEASYSKTGHPSLWKRPAFRIRPKRDWALPPTSQMILSNHVAFWDLNFLICEMRNTALWPYRIILWIQFHNTRESVFKIVKCSVIIRHKSISTRELLPCKCPQTTSTHTNYLLKTAHCMQKDSFEIWQ